MPHSTVVRGYSETSQVFEPVFTKGNALRVYLAANSGVDIGDVTLTAGSASIGTLGANSGVDIGDVDIGTITPYPVFVVTATANDATTYTKHTPNANNLDSVIRARLATADMLIAANITHKILDATTIAAADATDLASSKTLADELLAETNVHTASTTYHQAADTAWYAGHIEDDATNLTTEDDMSSLATGYTLADALDDDVTAHLASVAFHAQTTVATDFGGTPDDEPTLTTKANLLRLDLIAHFADTAAHSTADLINFDAATATTPGTDEASTQTMINLLKAYFNSHCAVGDATAADLAAVVVCANACQDALLAHYNLSATVHGGTGDATNYATLNVVAVASDQATANTLLTACKDTVTLHYAIVEGGLYQTVPAGQPFPYPSLDACHIKLSASSTIEIADFRSA